MGRKRMPIDEEEVKQFEKAFSLCRTCDHIMMAHIFFKGTRGRCIDSKVVRRDEHERCTCLSYIPKDNLEFLEWANEKKEKQG